MDVGSISRVNIVLEISNKGFAEGKIVRYFSPLTAAGVLKSLPVQRRAHKFENRFVYIETELALGREKQKSQFKRGEIAYMTFHGAICIFLNDTFSTAMNPLGFVLSNLDLLESIAPGDLLSIRQGS
jgi:uncharacterized protein